MMSVLLSELTRIDEVLKVASEQEMNLHKLTMLSMKLGDIWQSVVAPEDRDDYVSESDESKTYASLVALTQKGKILEDEKVRFQVINNSNMHEAFLLLDEVQ
jgi:hypothetical protein